MANAWTSKRYSALYDVLVRPTQLFRQVNHFWNDLSDPRDYHAARIAEYCGYPSKGRAVFYYLLREMIQEDEWLLQNVKRYLCEIIQKRNPRVPRDELATLLEFDFMLESRERAARYLTVRRAEARMFRTGIPEKIDDWPEEPWMKINWCRQSAI